jgi:hypothetical protein
MKIRPIMRLDPRNKVLRVCSVLWDGHNEEPGYRARLSVALRPALFSFWRERDGWFLTVAGLRMHFRRHPFGGLT